MAVIEAFRRDVDRTILRENGHARVSRMRRAAAAVALAATLGVVVVLPYAADVTEYFCYPACPH